MLQRVLRAVRCFPRVLPRPPPRLSSHGPRLHTMGWMSSDLSKSRSQLRPYSSMPAWRTRTLDARFFSANSALNAQPLPILSPPAVGRWLMFSSTLVFAVIVVGGVTRLTESGLSITEWRPITGILPPLSQREWDEEFEKYKCTPEFKL
jgi:hypothetical protein